MYHIAMLKFKYVFKMTINVCFLLLFRLSKCKIMLD